MRTAAIRRSLLILTAAAWQAAPAGTDYQADLITVSFSGGLVQGGQYTAAVSIGQIEAASQDSGADGWQWEGGFWPAVSAPESRIFSNGFETSTTGVPQ